MPKMDGVQLLQEIRNNELEIKVIILRFGLDSNEPRTLQEVGEIIGVCRERIRQIEEKAKRKLRRVPELEGVILRRQHGV